MGFTVVTTGPAGCCCGSGGDACAGPCTICGDAGAVFLSPLVYFQATGCLAWYLNGGQAATYTQDPFTTGQLTNGVWTYVPPFDRQNYEQVTRFDVRFGCDLCGIHLTGSRVDYWCDTMPRPDASDVIHSPDPVTFTTAGPVCDDAGAFVSQQWTADFGGGTTWTVTLTVP